MSQTPKICLIYTGGTIGMKKARENGGEVLRPPDNPKDFLDVAPELDAIVEFEEDDFVPLMNKDSTNINPKDWIKIATAIHERLFSGYRGFVVAHGTDTMHFSASAVAFALGLPLNVPVVFTGAQTHPQVLHGDARVNLLRAARVAITEDIGEVVISFGDYVFRGCRAQKKDERRFDAFESPALYPIAYITEEIDVHPNAMGRDEVCDFNDKNSTRVTQQRDPSTPLRAVFESGVAQVSLIPGLEPKLLEPIVDNPDCQGLILQSFGAGNVPSEDEYGFRSLIERAKNANKPVIITSQFPANATLHTSYEPGKLAREAGAIATGNMTNSCAVAKFRWVLAQVNDRIARGELGESDKIDAVDEGMQNIYIGEMDPAGGGENH